MLWRRAGQAEAWGLPLRQELIELESGFCLDGDRASVFTNYVSRDTAEATRPRESERMLICGGSSAVKGREMPGFLSSARPRPRAAETGGALQSPVGTGAAPKGTLTGSTGRAAPEWRPRHGSAGRTCGGDGQRALGGAGPALPPSPAGPPPRPPPRPPGLCVHAGLAAAAPPTPLLRSHKPPPEGKNSTHSSLYPPA